MDKTANLDELHRRKLFLYYSINGAMKGMILAVFVGALVGHRYGIELVIYVALAIVGFSVVSELLGSYSMEMKWHNELLQKFGDEYREHFCKTVEQSGYLWIVRKYWILNTHHSWIGCENDSDN